MARATSGDGFHGTMTASGGVDQRQQLPRHGEGQRQRRPVATASTSRQRPAVASTSGSLTTVGSDLGLTSLNLDLRVFFIFEN
jgi:hypothetical protein